MERVAIIGGGGGTGYAAVDVLLEQGKSVRWLKIFEPGPVLLPGRGAGEQLGAAQLVRVPWLTPGAALLAVAGLWYETQPSTRTRGLPRPHSQRWLQEMLLTRGCAGHGATGSSARGQRRSKRRQPRRLFG